MMKQKGPGRKAGGGNEGFNQSHGFAAVSAAALQSACHDPSIPLHTTLSTPRHQPCQPASLPVTLHVCLLGCPGVRVDWVGCQIVESGRCYEGPSGGLVGYHAIRAVQPGNVWIPSRSFIQYSFSQGLHPGPGTGALQCSLVCARK